MTGGQLTGVSLQYLLHYLLSVKNWLNRYSWQRSPVSITAWALLRDSYHGGAVPPVPGSAHSRGGAPPGPAGLWGRGAR